MDEFDKKLEGMDAMALVFAAKSGLPELALELERQGFSDEGDSLDDARLLLPVIEAAEAAAWRSV